MINLALFGWNRFLLTFLHMLISSMESFSLTQTGHTRADDQEQADDENDHAVADNCATEIRTIERRL